MLNFTSAICFNNFLPPFSSIFRHFPLLPPSLPFIFILRFFSSSILLIIFFHHLFHLSSSSAIFCFIISFHLHFHHPLLFSSAIPSVFCRLLRNPVSVPS